METTKKCGEYRFWDVFKNNHVFTAFDNIFIITTDTIKYEYLLKFNIGIKKHVFLTGNTGTGKTSIIKNTINMLKDKGYITPINLIFSAQTSSLQTQNSIISKLEHKRKDLLSGFGTTKAVIFLDDVNMPALQEYGASPPIELIRTLIDYSCFYERSKHYSQKILDATILCSAAPAEGGRQRLPGRFTRHFHILSLPSISEESMMTIFTTILNTHNYTGEVAALTNALVGGTINIYTTVCNELLPTPNNSHYLFNLRDIAKVIQGVMQGSSRIINNAEALVRLWVNEVLRVFSDRLTTISDKY